MSDQSRVILVSPTPEAPPKPDPAQFRDLQLGTWSSHPHFAATKLRILRRATLVAGVASAGILALAWWWSFRWSDVAAIFLQFSAWVEQQAKVLALLGCLLGGIGAFLVVAALQVRASLVGSMRAREASVGSIGWLIGVLVLSGLVGATLFAAAWATSEFWVRVALTSCAVAPLPLLALYLEFAAEEAEAGKASIAPARLVSSLTQITLVVLPFVFFQVVGEGLSTDVSGWLTAKLTSIGPGSWLSGTALTPDAPQWLRDIAEGRYGTLAKDAWESAVAGLSPTITDAATRVSDAIRSTLDPVVRRFCRVLSVLALLPALFTAIGLSIKIINRAESAANPKVDEPSQAARRGCLGGIIDLLVKSLRWLVSRGKRESDMLDDVSEDAPLPQWVAELVAHVPDGVRTIVHSVPEPTRSVAERSLDATFDWLFGGLRPTVDQVQAVRELHESHVAALRNDATGEGRIGAAVHADFFLEADGGAGASSTLDALAVAGAITRGQRILYLCPSVETAQAARSRIGNLLKRALVADLFLVGRIDAASTGRWSVPRGRRNGEGNEISRAVPDILVGTLNEWESLIQSQAVERDVVVSTALDIELILVDDFGRGRGKTQEAIHLPFVLDKHRLLLAAESRVVQTVVVIPPIGDGGEGIEEILSKRLFGGNMAPRSCRLRRWKAEPLRIFDVYLDAGAEAEKRALKSMVRACIEQGLKVLVLKSGADPERRSEIAKDLAHNGQTPDVLVSVDEADDRGRGSAQAVFLRWGLRGDSVASISAKLDDGGTVFFRLIPDSADQPQGDEITIPVLASSRSRAFALAHLRSAYSLLKPNIPIHRGYWAMLGLREEGDVAHFLRDSAEPFFERGHEPALLVDPPEGAAPGRSELGDGPPDVWQFIARKGIQDVRAELLPLSAPLPDNLRIAVAEGGASIVFGKDGGGTDWRRYAEWRTERGTSLGRMDLALCDRLLYEEGGQRYHAIATMSSGRVGEPHVILGDFYHAETHELSIPVLDVQFTIEPHAKVEGPQSLVTAAAEWYDFVAAGRPLKLTTSIVKLADEDGNVAVCRPLTFDTEVGVSLLTIGMPMPHEQRLEWVRAYFAGNWTTSQTPKTHGQAPRTFWPALTMVLHIALRRLMPDLLAFARVLAFRPPSDGAGAVVFFLEPLSTAGTAGEPFRAVLRRPGLRKRLAEAVEAALARLSHPDPNRGERPVAMSPTYQAVIDAGWPDAAELDDVAAILSLVSRDVPSQTAWVPTGQVGQICSPHHPRSRRWAPPDAGKPVAGYPPSSHRGATEAGLEREHNHSWCDVHGVSPLAWEGEAEMIAGASENAIRYGIELEDFEPIADAHNQAFGYRREELGSAENQAAHAAACGFRFGESTIRPDYRWIVLQAKESLSGLATRIVALSEQAGATSDRARITAVYSFVRSLRYELIQPLGDGKERHGVRLPTDMLARRAGDCDSACLLFLSLLAAAGLAEGGLVVTHDHAMVALDIPFDERSEDFLELQGRRLLLAECTHAEFGRIGRVVGDLVHEAVEYHAIPSASSETAAPATT